MALYTAYNKKQIEEIISLFKKPTPYRFEGVVEGTVNTYYRLIYSDYAFYLKVDEVGNLPRLKREIEILELLKKLKSQLGFETPTLLHPSSKKQWISYHGKRLLLLSEVKGKSLFGNKLKPKNIYQAGVAMAKMHKATQRVPLAPHRFDLTGQKKVFSEIKTQLNKKHPQVFLWIKQKLASLAQTPKLPQGLIHADLFPENMLFFQDQLTGFLDFEASGQGPFLFDMCVFWHACCHNGKHFDPSKAQAFLQGYQSVRPMTQTELAAFHLLYEQSAMRFLLTRLRDFELKEGPVKASPFKDYREYLHRFNEIQDLIKILPQKRKKMPTTLLSSSR